MTTATQTPAKQQTVPAAPAASITITEMWQATLNVLFQVVMEGPQPGTGTRRGSLASLVKRGLAVKTDDDSYTASDGGRALAELLWPGVTSSKAATEAPARKTRTPRKSPVKAGPAKAKADASKAEQPAKAEQPDTETNAKVLDGVTAK